VKLYDQAQVRAQSYYPAANVQQPFFGSAPQEQYYPGSSQPYYGLVPTYPQTSISPAHTYPAAGYGAQSGSGLGIGTGLGSGSGFNISQLKNMVDRMGGIDGIMGHVTRIQKVVQSIQQLSPMLKLLMNSFGGKAKTAELDGSPRSKRRRRTVKNRSTGKKQLRKRLPTKK